LKVALNTINLTNLSGNYEHGEYKQ
jgi:hypothetical protein